MGASFGRGRYVTGKSNGLVTKYFPYTDTYFDSMNFLLINVYSWGTIIEFCQQYTCPAPFSIFLKNVTIYLTIKKCSNIPFIYCIMKLSSL